jgi:signal transduction histidine kinase
MNKFKVLHIEDEPEIRDLVRRALEDNYTVDDASTGLDGIKKAQEFRPDLILMDLQLPSMSGYEATTRIQSIDALKHIPIVAVTGNNTQEEREKSLAAGCSGFISKPIDLFKLRIDIDEYISGKKFEAVPEQTRNKYFRKYSEELVAKLQYRVEELTEANQEMTRLNKELARINQFKDEFMANMSHELRTPLNSIIGFSEILVDGLAGDINEEQQEFINNILSSGKHLLLIINDILDLSKIRSGRMKLYIEEIRSDELITDIRQTISGVIQGKNQQFTQIVNEKVTTLNIDKKKVKQVLLNLLGNANKFTSEGGTIELQISPAQQNGESAIRFSVADSGIGISPENFELIFDEFRQVDGSHSREYEGTGLGLPIAKKLVELHGGKIWVESKVNHGTTFHFTLPVNFSPEDGV